MRARVFALGAGLGLLACGPDDGATSDEPSENVITTAMGPNGDFENTYFA